MADQKPIELLVSDHFLDTYVAHKLSALTECGAQELTLESKWLNTFILKSAMHQQETEKRAYALNFIRRAEDAFSAYREARQALLKYVNGPRNTISAYFQALANFESCLSYSWQACALIQSATGEKLYVQGSNS